MQFMLDVEAAVKFKNKRAVESFKTAKNTRYHGAVFVLLVAMYTLLLLTAIEGIKSIKDWIDTSDNRGHLVILQKRF